MIVFFIFHGSLPSSQAVRETSLLCQLCDSLEGCQESLKARQKNQDSTPQVSSSGMLLPCFVFHAVYV